MRRRKHRKIEEKRDKETGRKRESEEEERD